MALNLKLVEDAEEGSYIWTGSKYTILGTQDRTQKSQVAESMFFSGCSLSAEDGTICSSSMDCQNKIVYSLNMCDSHVSIHYAIQILGSFVDEAVNEDAWTQKFSHTRKEAIVLVH